MLTFRYVQKTAASYARNKVKQWLRLTELKKKSCIYVNCIKNKYIANRLAQIIEGKMSPAHDRSQPFKFTDYDCIGFDLDNTICRYKIGNMIKMEYMAISSYLVKEKKYSDKYLMLPIEENLDFMIKGLVLDLQRGNILRIDPNGHILHGTHGTKELSREELNAYYGEDRKWEVTSEYSTNPLQSWNGPTSQKVSTFCLKRAPLFVFVLIDPMFRYLRQ